LSASVCPRRWIDFASLVSIARLPSIPLGSEVDLLFARKNTDTKVRLLSGVSLFSTCCRGELGRIASLVEEVEIPTGKVLVR